MALNIFILAVKILNFSQCTSFPRNKSFHYHVINISRANPFMRPKIVYLGKTPKISSEIIHLLKYVPKIIIFDPYLTQKGISVLTKRSTHVDQNLKSYKRMYQLFVATFTVSITLSRNQKSSIY